MSATYYGIGRSDGIEPREKKGSLIRKTSRGVWQVREPRWVKVPMPVWSFRGGMVLGFRMQLVKAGWRWRDWDKKKQWALFVPHGVYAESVDEMRWPSTPAIAVRHSLDPDFD